MKLNPYQLFLSLVLPCFSVHADDAPQVSQIEEALGKLVLSKDLSTAEVREFIEPRIAKMPDITTREQWLHDAEELRTKALQQVVLRGKAADWDAEPLRVKYFPSDAKGPGYRTEKLAYEAIPGVWVPAILYIPEHFEGRVPVVLNVNGHDAQGKAADYKQIRCINQAKRGMLSLNVEWYGMGQLKGKGYGHGQINAIDLCGTSGIALHYEMLRRGIDVLLMHPSADQGRVAVTGLSGGGLQKIFISGLDPRVTLANPVAGFSSYHTRNQYLADLGDSEQTPSDLAAVIDPQHLVAMRAPRPTLLTYNAKDTCCYVASRALPPLLDAAAPVYKLFDVPRKLTTHINEDPGDHNYGLDNRLAFYRALNESFAEPGKLYPAEELPFEGEIRTLEELTVELPADNLDFNGVAARLAADLPRTDWRAPATSAAALSERRGRLRAIVKPYDPPAVRHVSAEQGIGKERVASGTYRLGTSWTVPFTDCGKPDAEVTLLLADEGRKSQAQEIERLVRGGQRVVAIDPFYFGESKLPERDYLFAILVACVGERPLGVQVGEVLGIARNLAESNPKAKLKLATDGPRTSVIALIAGALDPEHITAVKCRKPLGSLKQLIERGTDVTESPELFCFGLLKDFDIAQIAALFSPRPILVTEPDERASTELSTVSGVHVQ